MGLHEAHGRTRPKAVDFFLDCIIGERYSTSRYLHELEIRRVLPIYFSLQSGFVFLEFSTFFSPGQSATLEKFIL